MQRVSTAGARCACVFASLFLFATYGLSGTPPLRIRDIHARHEAFGRKVKTLVCTWDDTNAFNYDGRPCTQTGKGEFRFVGHVKNAKSWLVAFAGYVPHYTHSDGVRHSGIDPSCQSLAFSDDAVFVMLDLNSVLHTVIGARLIQSEHIRPDILAEGRTLSQVALERPELILTPMSGTRYRASFSCRGGGVEETVVDVGLDCLVISRKLRNADGSVEFVRVEDTQVVDGLVFPKRVVYGETTLDGAPFSSNTYVYGAPKVNGPVELWVPRLPPNLGIYGAKKMMYTDERGNLHEFSNKHSGPPRSDEDFFRLVQFASLALLVGSVALLIFTRKRKVQPR